MSINTLYSLGEQIDILWEVGERKGEFERLNTPKKGRFYFTKLATKYKLIDRLEQETEKLATNKEIANLFGVSVNSIDSYLKRHMHHANKRKRGLACLEKARSLGWEGLRDSGNMYKFTEEDNRKAGEATKKFWMDKKSSA